MNRFACAACFQLQLGDTAHENEGNTSHATCVCARTHLEISSSPVTALGNGENLGVVSGAGLTDWLPLM